MTPVSGLPLKEPIAYFDARRQKSVNHSALKRILAAEGFTYKDKSAESLPQTEKRYGFRIEDWGPKVVFLLSAAVLRESKIADKWVDVGSDPLFGALKSPSIQRLLLIRKNTSKRDVCKWLENCNECVVCFEDEIKEEMVVCNCGTRMCFGCLIDLLLTSKTQMTFTCPNCRALKGPMTNLLCVARILQMKQRPLPSAITAIQRRFIEQLLGIDSGTHLVLPCGLRQLEQFAQNRAHKKAHKTEAAIFTEARAFIHRKSKVLWRRKQLPTASAQSSAVVGRTSDGCANCGKSFWDKCERKRAPKCLKCKRTAYCCAKCRKRHWKTHASECTATTPKRKRKTRRKPTTKGCTPY